MLDTVLVRMIPLSPSGNEMSANSFPVCIAFTSSEYILSWLILVLVHLNVFFTPVKSILIHTASLSSYVFQHFSQYPSPSSSSINCLRLNVFSQSAQSSSSSPTFAEAVSAHFVHLSSSFTS